MGLYTWTLKSAPSPIKTKGVDTRSTVSGVVQKKTGEIMRVKIQHIKEVTTSIPFQSAADTWRERVAVCKTGSNGNGWKNNPLHKQVKRLLMEKKS